MLSREELGLMRQQQQRDRLFALADTKPMNVKRKSAKSPSRSVPNKLTHKLSIQDFVRSDPSYTPNIEHLVFPDKRKGSPVKASSIIGIGGSSMDGGGRSHGIGGKTRSRLAEMFALSRHLQQRSADRDVKSFISRKSQPMLNRSVDSSLQSSKPSSQSRLQSSSSASSGSTATVRRWATTDEPVHGSITTSTAQSAVSRLSPQPTAALPADTLESRNDMATARGPNVSILHLRSTSEPWETSPTSAYAPSGSSGSSRSYSGVKGVVLTKHQSLGGTSTTAPNNQRKNIEEGTFYTGNRINSQELYVSGGMCSRELSPVRWCDQEVDGVYLGRSGWVQVQQRSLDDNRRTTYTTSSRTPTTSSLPQYKRPGIKLADYHCNSEPGKMSEVNRSLELQRPAYLPLKTRDVDYPSTTSSPHSIPESFSPPPITPIISPPPAFQDRIKPKARLVYGKPPFLPRSDAIVDSDIISPPTSPPPPPLNWGSSLPEGRQPALNLANRKTKLTPSPVSGHSYNKQSTRIPQAKSLEEATSRRSQFSQKYKESSSSSSSSLGFRSLDSCVSRPVMPRLAEHSRSMDMYEDADEEDNNSSSLNLSNVSSIILNSSPDSVIERTSIREKTSPSQNRTRLLHYRSQSHRSPSSSDANKQVTCSSPSSSSSSGSGFPVRSPINTGNAFRRSAPNRQHVNPRATQEDLQRVRRSKSLQLSEKRSPGSVPYREQMRVSPQMMNENHRANKMNSIDRKRVPYTSEELNEEMLREAEVVTEFLYGNRNRAAAKALLMQRYHGREDVSKDVVNQIKVPITNNGYNVYIVGNNKVQRQKPLQRGSTAPNLPYPQSFTPSPTTEMKNPCNSSTCDFWPHCAQRDSLNSHAQNVYGSVKVSPNYPRSPQSDQSSRTRDSTPEPMKKRNGNINSARASPDSKAGSYLQRRAPTPSERISDRDRDDSEVSVQYVRDFSSVRRPTSVMSSLSSRDASVERKTSPINPKSRSPSAIGNSSCSSSSSDIWITTSDRTITKSPRNLKSSGTSTPMEDHTIASITKSDGGQTREMILTRPGSAPVNVEEEKARLNSEFQKRSMSLPKSFLSGRNKQG